MLDWKLICEKNMSCHQNDLKTKTCMIKLKLIRRLIQSERSFINQSDLTYYQSQVHMLCHVIAKICSI